jgi:hypothetical protein
VGARRLRHQRLWACVVSSLSLRQRAWLNNLPRILRVYPIHLLEILRLPAHLPVPAAPLSRPQPLL